MLFNVNYYLIKNGAILKLIMNILKNFFVFYCINDLFPLIYLIKIIYM